MSTAFIARLVVFVAFFDLFCQLPIIAPFARQLGADPLATSVMVASYDAANLIGNIAAGFVLVWYGRERSLVAGLMVSGAALAAYGFATGPWEFGLIRAFHGLGQAVLSPGAFTLLSDSVPVGKRAQAMGSAGAFIAVAAVAGPPVAGIVASRFGAVSVFQGVSLAMVLVAVFVALIARRRPSVTSVQLEPQQVPNPASLLTVLLRPQLLVAYVACLSWTAGIGTLVVHLPLLLETRGVSASVRGSAFGVYALVALVLLARPAPMLINRFGRLRVLSVGLMLIGISLFGLAIASSTAGIYGAMALFGFGFGLLFPAATAYLADQSNPQERGLAYGVFYAAYSLGVVVGEVGSGQLAEAFGIDTVLPFIAFGALAVMVAGWVAVVSVRTSVQSAAAVPVSTPVSIA